MKSFVRFLCVAGLTVAGAMGAAVAYLHFAGDGWFGSDDLIPMTFWSVLLGLIVATAARLLWRRLGAVRTPWRFAVLVPIGGLIGLGWTMAVAWFIGPWIFTFGFPVLSSFVGGGLLGGIGAASIASPRTWPIALLLAAAVGLGVVRLNAWINTPDPQVRVIVKPDATAEEVQAVWDDVLGHPVGASGHDLLPGISQVTDTGRQGNSEVLVVSLEKRMSDSEREALMARIRSSPLVTAVVPVVPEDSTAAQPPMSY